MLGFDAPAKRASRTTMQHLPQETGNRHKRARSGGPRRLILSFLLPILALALSAVDGRAAEDHAALATRDFRGMPYYQFFGPKDLDSSSSSRFIEVSSDGSFFYGDHNWVSFYDGSSWRKVHNNAEGAPIITSMRWTEDGTIYAGSFNAIGTVAIGEDGHLEFRQLNDKSVSTEAGEFFGSIQVSDTHVYFEGKRTVAIYEKATGNIRTESFDTWITASFFYGDTYFVATDFHEIYRDAGERFELDETLTEDTRDVTIADAVTLPNGDVAMGSERNGLYRFDGRAIKPAYPNFNDYKGHLFSDLALAADGRLIAAIMGLGVVVLDDEGNTLEAFGGERDYRFKSARAVTIDRSGTVWAMFNSSVAKVLLDSPLTAIDERLRPSLFYASTHALGSDLFLRNFYILYQAEFDDRGRLAGFRNALPDFEWKIWDVEGTPDALFLVTDGGGIFRYSGDALLHVGDGPAYDRFERAVSRPDLFVAANSRQFVLYRFDGDKLIKLHDLPNPRGFVNRLVEDGHGAFWLEYGVGSAGKLEIVGDTLSFSYYDHSNGLPEKEWMTLWMHEGEARYTSPHGALMLDPDTSRFERDGILDAAYPDGNLRISRAISDPQGNIWLSANNANTILWKQADGSYEKDERSLSEMGEPYFEFVTFFGDNEAILVTSFELFHYKPNPEAVAQLNRIEPTRITRISSVEDDRVFFSALGDAAAPARRSIPFKDNSLLFRVSNSYSLSTLPLEFQFHLRGFSESAPPAVEAAWTTSSETHFTNLDSGEYTFMARAKLGNGVVTPWTEYSFAVTPPFYRTYWAYGIYALLLVALIQGSIRIYLRQLMLRNLKLKAMVEDRTREIEQKNNELEQQADELASKNIELATQSEEIHRNARELTQALSELRSTQDQLLVTARKAGMSEVATNVLHNVGNVLNSVNVSLSNLSKRLAGSRIDGLRRLASLVAQHRDGLAEFISSDPKGKAVPDYLIQLAQVIEDEFKTNQIEVAQMERNVEHIKRIIATQQSHARSSEIREAFEVGDLVESALSVALGHRQGDRYQVTLDFEGDLRVESDKHKILQILINLLKNGDEAIFETGSGKGRLNVACHPTEDDDAVEVTIADNGVGIRPGDKSNLFTHGFTTKRRGNGFGLHSCAIDIKTLGGDLRLSSDGPGLGAVATLIIPRKAARWSSAPREQVEAKA